MKKAFILSIIIMAICSMNVHNQTQEIEFKVFKSSDGIFQLNIPLDWEYVELNEEAEVQVGNETEETYLILLTESKEDFFGWNLDKHSRITLGNLLASIDFPEIKGPVYYEINGDKAIQFEIQGSTSGLNICYVHTTVETKKNFNQILAWSLKSKYKEKEPILKHIVNSFKDFSE